MIWSGKRHLEHVSLKNCLKQPALSQYLLLSCIAFCRSATKRRLKKVLEYPYIFIALTAPCLDEVWTKLVRIFQWNNVPVYFFEFLILLLFRSHNAEIIVVKCLIQGPNNVTRVRLNQGPIWFFVKTTLLTFRPRCWLASKPSTS